MTKKAIFFFSLGLLLILAGVGILIKVLVFDQRPLAALQVITNQESDIYINGQHKGKTPYKDEKLAAGEYTIKLQSGTLVWETKVKLTAQTVTFIKRNLAVNDQDQSGQILSLESITDQSQTEVAITSEPKGALIKLDGKAVGATPMTINTDPADHEIILSYPEYADEIIRGRAIKGYRLNIFSQLSKNSGQTTVPIATPSPIPTPKTASISAQIEKPYVVIKNTPTGWLRVRVSPSSSATESGRVNPQEKFPYVEKSDGWVKIKYKNDFGWVSSDYVQVVN